MCQTEFEYDVFLSYSSKDKDIVRDLANRLKSDGVRVWFDDWEIRPGDNIPHKIETGLEHSRVLVLCMSAHAFGSDWARLESQAFRFKDPLNLDGRFIPLRLDDATIKGSLEQLSYIDWRVNKRGQEYPKLLGVCRTPVTKKSVKAKTEASIRAYSFSRDGRLALTGGEDNTVRLWDMDTGQCHRVLEGHTAQVGSVVLSTDQRLAVTGSEDRTVRIWDVEAGRSLHIIEGHKCPSYQYSVQVALCADQTRVLSALRMDRLRLWDVGTGECISEFAHGPSEVTDIALSSDQRYGLVASMDDRVRLWDMVTGRFLHAFKGHTSHVYAVAWSTDQLRCASGSDDRTVRVWDVDTSCCLHVFEGHTGQVVSVAFIDDLVLSGSTDKTVRLWDTKTDECLCVLEGHTSSVFGVEWSPNGRRAFSGDYSGDIRVWDLSKSATEM